MKRICDISIYDTAFSTFVRYVTFAITGKSANKYVNTFIHAHTPTPSYMHIYSDTIVK